MRVIKLGGSLLDFDGWEKALLTWLAGQPTATSILIVGGGRKADAVRAAQGLDSVAAHWAAIRAMAENADSVLKRLGATRVRALTAIERLKDGSLAVLDPFAFLNRCQDDPRPRVGLPQDWSVTSDSIAAWVATAVGADELVLLKSCLPVQSTTRRQAALDGYIDAYFPQAAAGIECVRCVNLRDATFAEVVLDGEAKARNPKHEIRNKLKARDPNV